jgi:hypothetical protein
LDQDRSASLLLRVWLENGTGFRARLASVDTSPGGTGREATVAVASSPGELLTAVEAWLIAFIGDGTAASHRPE